MSKLLNISFSLIIILIISAISLLAVNGIETKKFNNFISQKINDNNKDINLELDTIKFKLDVKNLSLFLETKNPNIVYKDVSIPTKDVKVYISFLSLIKNETSIKKIKINLEQLDISELKKLSKSFKPSNLNSFLNNKIKKGKLNTEIEVYLDNNNFLENFIARGTIENFKAKVFKNIDLDNTYFTFFADRTDVLIKDFSGVSGPIKISEGDIKLKLSPEFELESNFKTKVKFNKDEDDISYLSSKIGYIKYISNIDAELNNYFFINFDNTYKVKEYTLKNSGKITNANLDLKNSVGNFFSNKKNKISFSKSEIKTDFSSNKNIVSLSGNYLINGGNYQNFRLENSIKKNSLNLNLELDYEQEINIETINYQKPEGKISNIVLNLKKNDKNLNVEKLQINDGDNSIFINGLKFKKKKLFSIDKILVKTFKDGTKNNDFLISALKNISIKGSKLDASNLPHLIKNNNINDNFSHISKNIEIDLENVIAPLSEKLSNFKLIGKIENGKFVKITSKGDFGRNNYLDISMIKNKKDEKKFLEIYSDLTKPLLTEFKFFKGLTGGKLLYTSVFDDNSSNSKLKIENFKVVNAPGMIKLLSLADLGGLADLAKGDGITFESLEINMEKNNNILKINEILALGPSISVLMEGYQDENTTSLRGTLVPAKTLNKMISKIPVIGDIVIPKDVGEGLFGISFKIKGPPGKTKTTINPIRTITPRFIQKILDKNKKR